MSLRRCRQARRSLWMLAALLLAAGIPVVPAVAQQALLPPPFAEDSAKPRSLRRPDAQRPAPPVTPANATTPGAPTSDQQAAATALQIAGPATAAPGTVEKTDLAPVMAGDGSGLPSELWRGLDVAGVETLLSRTALPPRSAALNDLVRRLLTAESAPADATGAGGARFEAIRAEALTRAGRIGEAGLALGRQQGEARRGEARPGEAGDPVRAALRARNEIGRGNRDKGCEIARAVPVAKAALPKPLRDELLLVSAICAAAGDNPASAGLSAELARDAGVSEGPGLAALDAVAAGTKPQVHPGQRLSLLEARLIEALGGNIPLEAVERAEPGLLALLKDDAAAAPAVRIASAEAAARANIISAAELAEVYRALGTSEPAESASIQTTGAGSGSSAIANPSAAQGLHRAGLFRAADSEQTPLRKVRLMRAFLDDARHAGLYLPALQMLGKASASITPVPEIGWYAETAIEIALASADARRARDWVAFDAALDRPGAPRPASSPATGRAWLALCDIVEAGPAEAREQGLAALEDSGVHGRLDAHALNRLATVLDALDLQVPMRLWEAASRAGQPVGGYLPPTGVLSELQDAAKRKEFGRTVLLVAAALGPEGVDGASILALGDSIRALRRAGLESDARRLAFEALFALWPRGQGQ